MSDKETLRPNDILSAIFGDDPKAVVSAIRGKRAKRLGKIKVEDKYEKRTIGKNSKGKPIVADTVYTKEHIAKEKAKEEAKNPPKPKKVAKAKKSKKVKED